MNSVPPGESWRMMASPAVNLICRAPALIKTQSFGVTKSNGFCAVFSWESNGMSAEYPRSHRGSMYRSNRPQETEVMVGANAPQRTQNYRNSALHPGGIY